MEYVTVGTGLFMAVIGLLVKKFPDLIAGYNTMSPERKKQVDIDGLSSWMRNCFLFMALLMILGYYLFTLLGWPGLANNLLLTVTLGVIPIMIIGAQRYDQGNSQSKTYLIIFGVVLTVGIAGAFVFYSAIPPTIELNNQTIHISGMYGLEAEVTTVELLPKMPRVKMRTNGFHFNETSTGNFLLENGVKAKLFLYSSDGPYILVKTKSGLPIFINGKTTDETNTLFYQLKGSME